MIIEEQEVLDQRAAEVACELNGHTYARVHGYWTGQPDSLKCVDICVCCKETVVAHGCEWWKWCVSAVRWAEIEEERRNG